MKNKHVCSPPVAISFPSGYFPYVKEPSGNNILTRCSEISYRCALTLHSKQTSLMHKSLLSIIFLLFTTCGRLSAQLYINEFSQGASGSKEFIELVVVGNRTCTDSTADIRLWIFDDNNNWHGSGGNAQGFYRFRNISQWANIPYGSVILIYNNGDRNTSLSLADDPTDSNNDGVYVVPVSSGLLEKSSNNGYIGATYTNTGNNWSPLGLRNDGDAVIVTSPSNLSAPYHSIAYGSNVNGQSIPATVNMSPSGSNRVYYLTNGNITTPSAWATGTATSLETPGLPNTAANAAWIQSLRTGTGNGNIMVRDTVTICSGALPYTWKGQSINTFGDSVATFNQGTCDTTFVLDLHSQPVRYHSISQTICTSQLPYTWNGKTVTTTGTHTLRDTSTAATTNCDSITTLTLTVQPVLQASISQAICTSQLPYTWNGKTVTTTGTHTLRDTATATNSCDSITTLTLTVHPVLQVNITRTICASQLPYTWNGKTVTTTGTHTLRDTSTAAATNCDSITTLTLTIQPVSQANITRTICASQLPYTWNGRTVTTTGTHTLRDTATAATTNCDSITTLMLTVQPVSRDTLKAAICYTSLPYIFNGVSYARAGTYNHIFNNRWGCDSIIVLDLRVGAAPRTINTALEGCSRVVYRNTTYTSSAILRDTARNIQGCDSIYEVVNIKVIIPKASYDTAAVCYPMTYTFGDRVLNSSGIYSAAYTIDGGCDSMAYLHLTVHPQPELTIDFDPQEKYCIGDTLTLYFSGATKYNFSEPPFTATESSASFILKNSETQYTVHATDDHNCYTRKSVLIFSEQCCDIRVPNAFTPNGDGLNDIFTAISPGHPKAYNLMIFNRYGNMVFQSLSINNGWDGTQNGRPVDVGTYYYVIEIECGGQRNTLKGDLTVIR